MNLRLIVKLLMKFSDCSTEQLFKKSIINKLSEKVNIIKQFLVISLKIKVRVA